MGDTLTPLSDPMHGKDFGEVVAVIVKNDTRYEKGAYEFVRVALDHTLEKLSKDNPDRDSPHVSGHELLEGIRVYALEQYGPMTMSLFKQWGIKPGRDFGQLVFNLVEYGVFGKTDSDRIEDFEGSYDFEEAFVEPFLPPSRRRKKEAK
jgi:uncharacterized repeat protein (TIGR04138 family)